MVHGDIRHLENVLRPEQYLKRVHNGIRHLEMFEQAVTAYSVVHDGIRHLIIGFQLFPNSN